MRAAQVQDEVLDTLVSRSRLSTRVLLVVSFALYGTVFATEMPSRESQERTGRSWQESIEKSVARIFISSDGEILVAPDTHYIQPYTLLLVPEKEGYSIVSPIDAWGGQVDTKGKVSFKIDARMESKFKNLPTLRLKNGILKSEALKEGNVISSIRRQSIPKRQTGQLLALGFRTFTGDVVLLPPDHKPFSNAIAVYRNSNNELEFEWTGPDHTGKYMTVRTNGEALLHDSLLRKSNGGKVVSRWTVINHDKKPDIIMQPPFFIIPSDLEMMPETKADGGPIGFYHSFSD